MHRGGPPRRRKKPLCSLPVLVAVGLAFGVCCGVLFVNVFPQQAGTGEGGGHARAAARHVRGKAPCHRAVAAAKRPTPVLVSDAGQDAAASSSLDALLWQAGGALREGADKLPSPEGVLADHDAPKLAAATAPRRRTGHPPYPTGRAIPHSAACGNQTDLVLFIAVLAAPTGRSRRSRQVLRDTWFKLANPRVAIRFFLALNEDGVAPPDVVDEADTKRDMVFVDTRDAYKNLFRKVNLLFKWICDNCPHVVHILKTDDDSFVRVDKLLAMMEGLPKERLYYGSFLKRMPARIRNRTTKILTNMPLPGNAQNFAEWPWYASGAGYIISHDMAKVIAYPPLPILVQSAEDRGVGMQFYGKNVTYMSDVGRLRPWGHCTASAILLHYQRDHGLMRRRYERAVRGENICGEGWKSNQMCQLVEQYAYMDLQCPGNTTISKVLFAGLGKHWVGTGYVGPCEEGPSALVPNPACFYNGTPTMQSVVEKACLNKNACKLLNDVRKRTPGHLPVKDPCRGQFKRLLVSVQCSGPALDDNLRSGQSLHRRISGN